MVLEKRIWTCRRQGREGLDNNEDALGLEDNNRKYVQLEERICEEDLPTPQKIRSITFLGSNKNASDLKDNSNAK